MWWPPLGRVVWRSPLRGMVWRSLLGGMVSRPLHLGRMMGWLPGMRLCQHGAGDHPGQREHGQSGAERTGAHRAVLPSFQDVTGGRRAPRSAAHRAFRRSSGTSLAVPGAAPWASTDVALALAVPHARRPLGMHTRLPASTDSTLTVSRHAFPVLPAMRAVSLPRGEARSRQQHHQTSCQNETMHHHSLLLAIRLSCRHRWPANRAGDPATSVACNSTEGRGASRAAGCRRPTSHAHPGPRGEGPDDRADRPAVADQPSAKRSCRTQALSMTISAGSIAVRQASSIAGSESSSETTLR